MSNKDEWVEMCGSFWLFEKNTKDTQQETQNLFKLVSIFFFLIFFIFFIYLSPTKNKNPYVLLSQ